MADGYANISNQDFVDIFEPASAGYSVTVPGYWDINGNLLAFAPLSAGTAAAAVGYETTSGADVNTVWAKKGSVVYALGCDGGTWRVFVEGLTGSPGVSSSCGLNFYTQSGSWYIESFVRTNDVTQASGPLPANAVYIKVAMVKSIDSSDGNAAGITGTNNASSLTAIGTAWNLWVNCVGTVSSESGSHGADFAITVTLYDSGQHAISTTNFTFIVETDES